VPLIDCQSIENANARVVTLNVAKIMGDEGSHEVASEVVGIIGGMPEASLVLNLKNVQFMASAMIGKLVLLRNKCNERQIGFSICDLGPNVAEAIGLVRLEKIIDVFCSEGEALNACCSRQSKNASA
jgi:anti-anti-sigma factor